MFRKMSLFHVLLLSLLFIDLSRAKLSSEIGINYGRIGDNLPPPRQSIELIKSMNAGGVKLYDANPEILSLLAGSNLTVSIMVPNNEIISVASGRAGSDEWIARNVVPHYPETKIRYLLVGNEILSESTGADRATKLAVAPAMNNLLDSLEAAGIFEIKIGTPFAMDVLGAAYPPSAGRFRHDDDVALSGVVIPVLEFLKRTESFFFIDVYPYFPWSENPSDISLGFALLSSDNNNNNNNNNNRRFTDPETGLVYENLLDQMLDAVAFAMERLGFYEIPLFIAETGWPTGGGGLGANVENAAEYVRNVVEKVAIGTPARPGKRVGTFLFSLFDENLKGGAGVEQHWGLLRANGTAAYEVDLARGSRN